MVRSSEAQFDDIAIESYASGHGRQSAPQHEFSNARRVLTNDLDLDREGFALDAAGLLLLIWQKKWLVLVAIVVSFLLGIAYLNRAVRTYTVELKVTAAASTSNSIGSRLGSLGGLAAAAGLGISSSTKAEPFDLYLEALTSREVADKLATDPRIMRTIFDREWDGEHHTWVEPPKTSTQVLKGVLGIANQPWHSPDGARLRDYLQRAIVITKSNKSPVTLIGFDATDPIFGIYLLAKMNDCADYQVRMRALQQAVDYQVYLTSILPTVALDEVRRSLADTLTQQYEAIMMAKSKVSYAAMTLGLPQASIGPTKPKAMIVLALSLLLGFIVGVLFAVLDFSGLRRRAQRTAPRAAIPLNAS